MSNLPVQSIVQKVLENDRRAVAQLITYVEDGSPEAVKVVGELYPKAGRAHVIGFTGPPGCGKSSLIYALAKALRRRGQTVGVVAVDPTSPYSGGALLGDRVRMQELATDQGVYIRSMATRGVAGGLARATRDVVLILDAAGMQKILVETAGAGQTDVDVEKLAATTVLVLAPGLGDEIQALKAGLMEIADIYVVNKSDVVGADKAVTEIRTVLELYEDKSQWNPQVLKTVATRDEGIENLIEQIEKHRVFIGSTRQEANVRHALIDALKFKIGDLVERELSADIDRLTKKIVSGKMDPYTAAEQIVRGLRKQRNRRKVTA